MNWSYCCSKESYTKKRCQLFCWLTLLHFNVEVSICNKTVKDELENDPLSGRLIVYQSTLNMKIKISYNTYIIIYSECSDSNVLIFRNHEVINGK